MVEERPVPQTYALFLDSLGSREPASDSLGHATIAVVLARLPATADVVKRSRRFDGAHPESCIKIQRANRQQYAPIGHSRRFALSR